MGTEPIALLLLIPLHSLISHISFFMIYFIVRELLFCLQSGYQIPWSWTYKQL